MQKQLQKLLLTTLKFGMLNTETNTTEARHTKQPMPQTPRTIEGALLSNIYSFIWEIFGSSLMHHPRSGRPPRAAVLEIETLGVLEIWISGQFRAGNLPPLLKFSAALHCQRVCMAE
jgi:hypothetical protein